MSHVPLKHVIFYHCEEILFFFELKKNIYLFFQSIKENQNCCLWTASVLLYGIEELCDRNRDIRRDVNNRLFKALLLM
nr:unnamed protein product [Callosobruchus analis]